jgi:hypothetical protein
VPIASPAYGVAMEVMRLIDGDEGSLSRRVARVLASLPADCGVLRSPTGTPLAPRSTRRPARMFGPDAARTHRSSEWSNDGDGDEGRKPRIVLIAA